MSDSAREDHRAFLNRYYGVSRRIYDLTRRYFLLGREAAIAHLVEEQWETLIEVGPGTGRNLRKLKNKRPNASYGGVEASDAMLEHAKIKVPFARMVHGFAETADMTSILGKAPDRILFAYCLSMVQEPLAALEHCRRQLAPGGEVVVVDFGDLSGWPSIPREYFRSFLDTFHVRPLPSSELESLAFWHTHGRGQYWSMFRFSPLEP
ncbi:MAG: class I SAM-dependent methyltransferase [Myxococcales bacterium]|nr:class I SAM-dependent methyltransferase [Myxococcales bacterium]